MSQSRAPAFALERSDGIDEAGTITRQIVDRVYDADLVVADLTDLNPNVFYELAVRHAFHKPVITIAQAGTKIPFDVAHQRMITYDVKNLDASAEARERIAEQAKRFAMAIRSATLHFPRRR